MWALAILVTLWTVCPARSFSPQLEYSIDSAGRVLHVTCTIHERKSNIDRVEFYTQGTGEYNNRLIYEHIVKQPNANHLSSFKGNARNINVTSEDHRYRIAFDINLGCAVINKLECIMERDMHTWEAVPKDVITDQMLPPDVCFEETCASCVNSKTKRMETILLDPHKDMLSVQCQLSNVKALVWLTVRVGSVTYPCNSSKSQHPYTHLCRVNLPIDKDTEKSVQCIAHYTDGNSHSREALFLRKAQTTQEGSSTPSLVVADPEYFVSQAPALLSSIHTRLTLSVLLSMLTLYLTP